MERDVNVSRETNGKREKKAGVNIYTLTRSLLFEAKNSQELTDMLATAINDRDNTIRNIADLQKHIKSINDEITQIQSLLLLAKEDEK